MGMRFGPRQVSDPSHALSLFEGPLTPSQLRAGYQSMSLTIPRNKTTGDFPRAPQIKGACVDRAKAKATRPLLIPGKKTILPRERDSMVDVLCRREGKKATSGMNHAENNGKRKREGRNLALPFLRSHSSPKNSQKKRHISQDRDLITTLISRYLPRTERKGGRKP